MIDWLWGSATRRPVLLRFRSSKTFITITVSSAVFTDIFCYGIVVPVLPFAIRERTSIGSGSVQTWISIFLAVYGGALLAAAPICGWLADRSSSRQAPLLLGLLALGGSTAMLCAGSSIGVLAAGRVLQGFSAAVVWVVGLALMADTVGPEDIGQAMGYVGLSMSLAMLIAPLLGGIVFQAAGYYAVFAMAFGLIALDVALRLFMIEKKVARRWISDGEAEQARENETKSRSDAEQGVRDIELGSVRAPGSDEVVETVEGGPGTSNGLEEEDPVQGVDGAPASRSAPASGVPVLRRLQANLPPVIFLLRSRRVCNAIWAGIVVSSLYTSFDAILPLFVRDTFGWNARGAGLIFLPIMMGSFLGPLIGWLSDRHGPRWYATAGYAMACPLLILLRLVDHDTLKQKVLLCALLALLGVCFTLALTPMMAEITYAVDAKAKRKGPGWFGKNGAYAQAYSLFNMAWAAGCLIGPLLGGFINDARGWGTTTLVMGCLSLVTVFPTLVWTGGSVFKARRGRKR